MYYPYLFSSSLTLYRAHYSPHSIITLTGSPLSLSVQTLSSVQVLSTTPVNILYQTFKLNKWLKLATLPHHPNTSFQAQTIIPSSSGLPLLENQSLVSQVISDRFPTLPSLQTVATSLLLPGTVAYVYGTVVQESLSQP